MKVRFSEDAEVRDHRGLVEQSFGMGEVVEMSTASARHWIKRNKAIEFFGAEPAIVKPAVPSAGTGGHGRSLESGQGKQSSASPPAQASTIDSSTSSDEPENKDAVEPSLSTAPTSAPSGPTSSTDATRPGGGKRATRRGSKG